MTDNNEKFDAFEREQAELRRWPYQRHRVDETLDAELISDRAKQLLFQSLAREDLVGFIGSGVPMAYGRTSWSEWLELQFNDIHNLAKAVETSAQGALDYISSELKILKSVQTENLDGLISFVRDENNFDGEDYQELKAKNLASIRVIKCSYTPEEEKNKILCAYFKTKKSEIEFQRDAIQRLYRTFQSMRPDVESASSNDFSNKEATIVFEIAGQLQKLLLDSVKLFISPEDLNKAETEQPLFSFNQELSHAHAPEPMWTKWSDFIVTLLELEKIRKSTSSIPDLFFGEVLKPLQPTTHTTSLKKIWKTARTRLNVEDYAKLLMVDETTHAERTLIAGLRSAGEGSLGKAFGDALEHFSAGINDARLSRQIEGMRQDPERYWALGFYCTSFVKQMLNETRNDLTASPQWYPLLSEIESQLNDNDSKEKKRVRELDRKIISPTHRYVVELLLRLSKDPTKVFRWKKGGNDEPEHDFRSRIESIEALGSLSNEIKDRKQLNVLLAKSEAYTAIDREMFKARGSIMDPALDPLEKLVIKFGVRRFLTLNYDFEIERYFQDRGYVKFAGDADLPPTTTEIVGQLRPRPNRVDGFGGILKDETFRRERANELVTFAIDAPQVDASVFHLHGRATRNAPLVITERDYMNLYVRDDEHRETVDESIRLAFSSNTLLFAGMGMSEADVLRPLRQFMSDKDRDRVGTAIVLKPGLKSLAQRQQEAGLLYLRFGVHTIYFGDAWVPLNPTPSQWEYTRLPWGYMVEKFLNFLDKKTDAALSQKETPRKIASGEAFLSELREDLGSIDRKCLSSKTTASAAAQHDTIEIFNCLFGYSDVDFEELNFREQGGVLNTTLHPIFTTARPGADKEFHKQKTEEYLGFEIRMLFYLVRVFLVSLPTDDSEAVRELKARKCLINGVRNGLVTALMTFTLDELHREKDQWASDWQKSPPERLPRFSCVSDENADSGDEFTRFKLIEDGETTREIQLPRLYVRHQMINVISNYGKICKNEDECKKYASVDCTTGIRAFDEFISAIGNRHRNHPNELGSGRRLYLICAPRGLGKGSIMSALMSDNGMAAYIKAHSLNESYDRYISASFINLSFSTEIASVFDMLIHAILEACEKAQTFDPPHNKDDKRSTKDYLKDLSGLPRLGRLKRAMRLFENLIFRKNKKPRILICFNAVDLMFFSRGLAKNREIEEILYFLTEARVSKYHFDLILLSSESKVPGVLTGKSPIDEVRNEADHKPPIQHYSNEKTLRFVPITRSDILLAGVHNVRQRMARSRLNFENWPLLSNEEGQGVIHYRLQKHFDLPRDFEAARRDPVQNPDDAWTRKEVEYEVDGEKGNFKYKYKEENTQLLTSDDACYVHFARPVRPENLLVDNFMSLAYAFFLLDVEKYCDTDQKRDKIQKHLNSTPQTECGDSSFHPRIRREERERIWKNIGEKEEDSPRQLWRNLRNSRNVFVAQNINSISEIVGDFTEEGSERNAWCVALSKANSHPPSSSTEHISQAKEYLNARYLWARDVNTDGKQGIVARQWQEVRFLLSDNRFCMTILLAAAERIALHGRTVREGAIQAEQFISSTIKKVELASVDKREQVVISTVLDSYEAYHEIGTPSEDINLHLLIMRHLAVIGVPLSADVLVRTPEMRAYFEQIYEGNERRREVRLIEALTELAERGLVFELSPHPSIPLTCERSKREIAEAEEDENRKNALKERHAIIFGDELTMEQRRYALHRAVQRHIIGKMGSGPRDSTQINQFAPSLYASMAADLPRLNRESYEFLKTLVESLSEYPDYPASVPGPQNWHMRQAPLTTRVQALRAALAIIRSTFSIAVVSRFEDYAYDDQHDAITRRGYFGAYRIHVRWLIRKAYELLLDDEKLSDSYRSYNPDFTHINALYIDEIVWLYNECGLVNLVQGNLSDANALLIQAIALNKRIEGEAPGGGQNNRITLNLAIVTIERGRLDRARDMLNAICASETQEGRRPGRVWHIAYGYLGLVHHLLGQSEMASDFYERAIEVLRHYDDSRACSVFLRHFGDLRRSMGLYEESEQLLSEALAFAQAGGHQDIENRCDLSIWRLNFAKMLQDKSRPNMRAMTVELKVILGYAKRMEMPALACDVYIAHAELLISDGETSQSGRLLSRAMTLAKRNGMDLRLNTALVRYAHVLALRGLKDQSNRLLFSALEMAKKSRNQLEIRAIDRVFSVLHSL